jgi:Ser/Thr protein kinase RdoA (MazF antagonist)
MTVLVGSEPGTAAAAALGEAYVPAARQALAAFGVVPAELRFVHVGENVTFRVTDARDGAPLVLRLHRPGYHDHAALCSEHVWTRALVAAGIGAPEPLPTLDGAPFAAVDGPAAGERRWAGLARWVEGDLLADAMARETEAAAVEGHLARLGAIMAALHAQATAWTPPPGFRRQRLDADGLLGPRPFWGPFWEHPVFSPGERALVLATRDRLHTALQRYGTSPQTFSLIHADLHPRNVLITADGAAVIDFDDAGFGWHLYDLAVALVWYQDEARFPALRDAVVRGYRSVRPLADADLALLPMFLLIRDMAQIGWYHERPELPREAQARPLKDRICRIADGFVPPL